MNIVGQYISRIMNQMVIKLKIKKEPQAPSTINKFTLKQVEDLFKVDNWKQFMKENGSKFWKENLDIYEWPVFPLYTKEDMFYRCLLHPTVEVKTGTKDVTVPFRNIYYEEFISHCIFYAPEEHKQYIIDKLKLS